MSPKTENDIEILKSRNPLIRGQDETGELTFLRMAEGAQELGAPPFKTPMPERFRTNPNTAHIISPTLREACIDFDWTNAEEYRIPINNGHVENLKKNIALLLKALNHPYHNLAHSVDNVAPSMKELMEKALVPTENGTRRFTEEEISLGEIAGLLHDIFHSGSTYRQLTLYLKLGENNEYRLSADENILITRDDGNSLEPLPLSAGAMFSNEEFACIIGDRLVGGTLAIVQRLELQGMKLATSFGQRNPALFPKDVPEELLQRPYLPHTWQEKLLAFADVSNFRGEAREWFEENFNVYREKTAEQIPDSYEDFLEERRKFLEFYVKDKLNDIKPLFEHDPDYLRSIENKLDALLDEIEKMKKGSSVISDWARNGFQELRFSFGFSV